MNGWIEKEGEGGRRTEQRRRKAGGGQERVWFWAPGTWGLSSNQVRLMMMRCPVGDHVRTMGSWLHFALLLSADDTLPRAAFCHCLFLASSREQPKGGVRRKNLAEFVHFKPKVPRSFSHRYGIQPQCPLWWSIVWSKMKMTSKMTLRPIHLSSRLSGLYFVSLERQIPILFQANLLMHQI